jgi:hypothetical protein
MMQIRRGLECWWRFSVRGDAKQERGFVSRSQYLDEFIFSQHMTIIFYESLFGYLTPSHGSGRSAEGCLHIQPTPRRESRFLPRKSMHNPNGGCMRLTQNPHAHNAVEPLQFIERHYLTHSRIADHMSFFHIIIS